MLELCMMLLGLMLFMWMLNLFSLIVRRCIWWVWLVLVVE